MNETMGEYGTFWFYMCWCIAGLFFVYFFLPETKGKSLEDIEKMFSKKQPDLHGVVVSPVDVIKTPESLMAEPISDKSSHSNDGYEYDSDDDEDNGEVVPTPV